MEVVCEAVLSQNIILLCNIKVIYRYLWTNTPLKIAFIMFSISSWFSCSWNKKHTFMIRWNTFGREALVKWLKCDIQLWHNSVVAMQLTQVQQILMLYNLINWICSWETHMDNMSTPHKLVPKIKKWALLSYAVAWDWWQCECKSVFQLNSQTLGQ